MLKFIFIFLLVIAGITVISRIAHSIQDKRDDERRAQNIASTASTQSYQSSRAQEVELLEMLIDQYPSHMTYEQKLYDLAEKGNAEAQYNLAMCYHHGKGRAQQEVKWLFEAAGQGHAMAQLALGTCYEIGRGITQDYQEAERWYRRAAKQGVAVPQEALNLSSRVPPTHRSEEYISQLEALYAQYGDNAFQHLTKIQQQTGYELWRIKADLVQVAAPKQPQMAKEAVKNRKRAAVNKKEYLSQLEDLFRKFGNNAFQHLDEIQAQTGYERWEIKTDLKKIRSQIEASQKQPQSKSSLGSYSAPQKASTPVPKAPYSSTPQTPPIPPQSTPKQSAPSTPQKIATPIVDIPFDLRYLPDLTFYSHEKMAMVFPDTVGSGLMLISPSPSCNFAEIGLIIDNYLVQFDISGYMHILDIVKDEYRTLDLSTIDKYDRPFREWVMQISSGVPALDRIIRNDQKAYKYLIAYTQLMYHHTYRRLGQDEYNMCLSIIQAAFGIPRNGNTLEIKNREWYHNGHKLTWGQLANNLFRDEKLQIFDSHSL